MTEFDLIFDRVPSPLLYEDLTFCSDHFTFSLRLSPDRCKWPLTHSFSFSIIIRLSLSVNLGKFDWSLAAVLYCMKAAAADDRGCSSHANLFFAVLLTALLFSCGVPSFLFIICLCLPHSSHHHHRRRRRRRQSFSPHSRDDHLKVFCFVYICLFCYLSYLQLDRLLKNELVSLVSIKS